MLIQSSGTKWNSRHLKGSSSLFWLPNDLCNPSHPSPPGRHCPWQSLTRHSLLGTGWLSWACQMERDTGSRCLAKDSRTSSCPWSVINFLSDSEFLPHHAHPLNLNFPICNTRRLNQSISDVPPHSEILNQMPDYTAPAFNSPQGLL